MASLIPNWTKGFLKEAKHRRGKEHHTPNQNILASKSLQAFNKNDINEGVPKCRISFETMCYKIHEPCLKYLEPNYHKPVCRKTFELSIEFWASSSTHTNAEIPSS